ncbi:nucleotide exchange factor GrpE [Candidatus Kaiserbacteria bacterium RIFCSPHIGHO2_01_FULL_56_24]|uniref:Protein GrpE n=1 Tax=Candidatus Kaiserbacteria bacterium RIFCSPHIGHO2_01_FULL_56_24 TaxID=1798487 RepID=A0A1F6DFB0_9BACT|nr:MAG: nucleotide exchange factor GrpE [Candidatus Kaiserbacteria bacterium RIFCSPHIGHO2_01_FULL_56_24]
MISPPSDNESPDIDFEPEDELGSVGALKAKMQKLRDELAEAKKERGEYLDGWQRAKADLVNAKRDFAQASQRSASMAKEAFLEEMIPALDSFDMAMLSDAWQNVDPAWRKGVESIRTQILGILAANGVETFGKEGEEFDPMLYEAIQEADGGVPHTVAKVLRSGYRTNDRILRPSQVTIFK